MSYRHVVVPTVLLQKRSQELVWVEECGYLHQRQFKVAPVFEATDKIVKVVTERLLRRIVACPNPRFRDLVVLHHQPQSLHAVLHIPLHEHNQLLDRLSNQTKQILIFSDLRLDSVADGIILVKDHIIDPKLGQYLAGYADDIDIILISLL